LSIVFTIIINVPTVGTGLPYGLHIRRMGHNRPRGPIADWWLLTTANAAGTNGLACYPKHGRARGTKFLVTHPMTDQSCLTSTIACQSALNAGHRALQSSRVFVFNKIMIINLLMSPLLGHRPFFWITHKENGP
jgi:hypothetical protein